MAHNDDAAEVEPMLLRHSAQVIDRATHVEVRTRPAATRLP
jgi:hypothetical protein